MKITFVGDIMLGRRIAERFYDGGDIVVPPLGERIREADLVVANLESVITSGDGTPEGHLIFRGTPALLERFKWIDCFSLANNHINDCGTEGMDETIKNLNKAAIGWNGLYAGDGYEPFLYGRGEEKTAVVTCTDMMNREFSSGNRWRALRAEDEGPIRRTIAGCKSEGRFTILYAHAGMLFSRFPNPPVREFCRDMIDAGADLVVTVHPHVVGGMEEYKGRHIFYSPGDFVMDGSSARRRRSVAIEAETENGILKNWELIPAVTNKDMETVLPKPRERKKILGGFARVSRKLAAHETGYGRFYARQYRREMFAHYVSTLYFILRTRGLAGITGILRSRRGAVSGMLRRLFRDRSRMRYDTDAVTPEKIARQ